MENKKFEKAYDELGEAMVKILTKNLIKYDKKASGDLIKSLDYKIINDVNGYILNLLSEPYLINVDKGRKPGLKQPPTSVIIPWVKKKGIKFQNATTKQTAFVIARSIGKKGIKATNVIKESMDELLKNKEKLLLVAREEDILEYIEKGLKEEKNIKIN